MVRKRIHGLLIVYLNKIWMINPLRLSIRKSFKPQQYLVSGVLESVGLITIIAKKKMKTIKDTSFHTKEFVLLILTLAKTPRYK